MSPEDVEWRPSQQYTNCWDGFIDGERIGHYSWDSYGVFGAPYQGTRLDGTKEVFDRDYLARAWVLEGWKQSKETDAGTLVVLGQDDGDEPEDGNRVAADTIVSTWLKTLPQSARMALSHNDCTALATMIRETLASHGPIAFAHRVWDELPKDLEPLEEL